MRKFLMRKTTSFAYRE